MNAIILSVIIVGAIGLVAGLGLSIAAMVMNVPVDKRIEEVRACLPGVNCGSCGFSGCDGYANAIVEDGAATNLCSPGGDEAAKSIASIMGSEEMQSEKMTAVVRCNGTAENCGKKSEYKGLSTCAAAAAVNGGDKLCPNACLGYGDCERACPFDAIRVVNSVAVVDSEKCTACKTCVSVCPRGVISMMPKEKRKAVTVCSNTQSGAVSRKQCAVSCVGCKMCEKACKFDAIHVENNLSRVDYEQCVGCGACVRACPTKCLYLSNH